MMPFTTPEPDAKAARPRKVTDARGGHITPEGAKAHFTGGTRGKYPKGNEPMPENTTWHKTGDPQENDIKQPQRATPPAVGNMDGDGRTMTNPLK